MATGWEALEAPEFASAVRLAAAVAADLLSDSLSESEARKTLSSLRGTPLPPLPPEQAIAFAKLLQNCLASVAELGGDMAARIKVAERIEESGAYAAGWGGETALVIMAVAFLAFVLNTEVSSTTSQFKFHHKAGVPAGMSDLLRNVTSMISAAVSGRAPMPDHDDKKKT